jgi:autotransporter-associated beta strand protein
LSGSGSLTHDGGTLALTNASALTGTLTIASGSLVLNAIVSGSGVTSATFTPSSLTVAFSPAPSTGDQFVLLAGATGGTYTVSLTGTTKTGTYNSSTSTLTIN